MNNLPYSTTNWHSSCILLERGNAKKEKEFSMSLKQNKKDFEASLKQVEDWMEYLSEVLHPSILDMLESVISEYKEHYKNSIEELEKDNEELEYRIENLEK